jgi:taurine dioxygenase
VRFGQDYAPGSANLLTYLAARASIPEYQVRWRWTPGSIAIWDNRSTQHYAVMDYWPAVRKMERAGISGDKPTRGDYPCSSWTTACCPRTRIRW